ERWESTREPTRVATPPVPADGEAAVGLENWFLTSETERAAEKFLDPSAPMGISTEIPAPGELVSSALGLPPAGVAGQALTAGSGRRSWCRSQRSPSAKKEPGLPAISPCPAGI